MASAPKRDREPSGLRVVKLGDALGAEVVGADLSRPLAAPIGPVLHARGGLIALRPHAAAGMRMRWSNADSAAFDPSPLATMICL